jgi:DDE superfamily endonuclease
VVDAVNFCESMKIEFPKDHAEQKRIAREFQQLCKAGFDICVGCIGGMLVWIHKPNDKDCRHIGANKFYSDCKKKFGLHMQAVCDANKRFLDVEINSPGATSDYLAFVRSKLRSKLETDGFLSPGLALFGDNAYVNSWYMAVPFKGNGAGSRGTYNFFHSRTRINIECAFGMLVHRWGILRTPIPRNINIGKTTALVTCLCRLHNYCIDQNEGRALESTNIDEFELMLRGAVPFDQQGNPRQLVGAGEHFNDTDRNFRRQIQKKTPKTTLPRDHLHQIVITKDFRRPAFIAL